MSGQQAACCKEQQHNKWKQPPLTEIRFWEQIWTWWAEGSDWVVDSEHVRGVLGAKPLRALLTKRRIFRVILCYIQCFSVVKCTCKDSGCGIVIWRPLQIERGNNLTYLIRMCGSISQSQFEMVSLIVPRLSEKCMMNCVCLCLVSLPS